MSNKDKLNGIAHDLARDLAKYYKNQKYEIEDILYRLRLKNGKVDLISLRAEPKELETENLKKFFKLVREEYFSQVKKAKIKPEIDEAILEIDLNVRKYYPFRIRSRVKNQWFFMDKP